MSYIKKQARRTRKKLGYPVTYEQLYHHAQDCGFTVLYYSEATSLIQRLKVKHKAEKSRAFIYHDDLTRFIFIEDSQTDKLFLLAHELGHFILGHDAKCTTKEEHEATLFAELVLKKQVNKRAIVAIAIVAATIAALSTYLWLHNRIEPTITNIQQEQFHETEQVEKREQNFVITRTGSKYHLPNCYYVSGKTDLTEITLEGTERLEYQACKICIRE